MATLLRNQTARSLTVTALLLGIGAASLPVSADDWVKVGERTIQGRTDRDTIPIRRSGRFKKLRFRVRGSGLQMRNVVVRFGNGRRYSPPTRMIFRAGEQSREINLPGGTRDLESVAFQYGNIGRRGRAQVYVYALRD